ncbi:hypothetical protein OWR29_07050 [Actinoplanes sp. Pm04-4]|uniref:Fibronectin type-III domain-containing protein n=1 Tax=Paractinoplanes pyxinae TaxID=2997416 RepID=A0ABT4AU15_9ACTN|nr:hypothetical protein [Actinoplanes pyxinae]MCY1137753.1 hypothetical protein [Actinoplanes pyxinae]
MRLRGSAYAVTTAGLVAATLFASPAAAFAAWDADAGTAIAGARAGELPAVGMPSVTAHGSSVTVDWPALKAASGVAVRGYRLLRSNALTGETVAAERGCSGLRTTTRCTEGSVPPGHWAYEVTALVGDSWRSAPGVAAPTTIARPAVAPPPASPAPTKPAPTTPAPSTSPTPPPVPSAPTEPATPVPTKPTEPATPAPSYPVSKPSPSGPAPSSEPVGPAPTASTAPSAELTEAPAPTSSPSPAASPSSAASSSPAASEASDAA